MILSIEEIKARSTPVFSGCDFVKAAYLFGSYARGEATEKSDVDIMVCLNREVGLEFFGLYDYLQTAFEKRVDVITEAESRCIMPRTIERDKVLIYECEHAWKILS